MLAWCKYDKADTSALYAFTATSEMGRTYRFSVTFLRMSTAGPDEDGEDEGEGAWGLVLEKEGDEDEEVKET